MEIACPVCQSSQYDEVLSIPDLPTVINAQVRPEDAPDVPRGDMDLVVCLKCGHLFNRSFDPAQLDYDATYENTLHYSEHFQRFARDLAERLVRDHRLEGADVAELGSGPGHFLSMLCEAGVGRAFGWDPSYDPARLGSPEHPAVTVSTDRFPDDGSVPVRLALSQHVLEHLEDPVAALRAQRAAVLATGGVVYTEIPNGELMVDQCALWDLVYEHLSYFVPTSLELACQRARLAVTREGSTFGDQFLWCEATPSESVEASAPMEERVAAGVEAAHSFGAAALERIDQARRDLAALAAAGPVALWGAGSKGMTYLNLVADVAAVAAVVDVNPRKAGWGVPGTSLVVRPPATLVDVQPQTVLAANPIYVDEISRSLRALRVPAAVYPLWT